VQITGALATALVAGDRALLELDGRTPFRIVKPSQFRLIREKMNG